MNTALKARVVALEAGLTGTHDALQAVGLQCQQHGATLRQHRTAFNEAAEKLDKNIRVANGALFSAKRCEELGMEKLVKEGFPGPRSKPIVASTLFQ
jgi:hypothetical protein